MMPRKRKNDDEEVLEVFEPESETFASTDEGDMDTLPTAGNMGSPFRDILDALDNEDSKAYFFSMLGYAPAYDEKGHFVGYVKRKKPDFDDQLVGILSAIRSGKVMALADYDDVEPLTTLEVEWKIAELKEIILLMAPPDVDLLHYIVPMEWATLEMKKNMSLAKGGRVVNALLGVGGGVESSPTYVEPPQEREARKGGIWGKLLGGG